MSADFGVRWQAERDTALAPRDCSGRLVFEKASSSLRFADAVQDVLVV